ncbi:MAG: hypothetical protein AB8B91_23830 [Rubripirellula sp.]
MLTNQGGAVRDTASSCRDSASSGWSLVCGVDLAGLLAFEFGAVCGVWVFKPANSPFQRTPLAVPTPEAARAGAAGRTGGKVDRGGGGGGTALDFLGRAAGGGTAFVGVGSDDGATPADSTAGGGAAEIGGGSSGGMLLELESAFDIGARQMREANNLWLATEREDETRFIG